MSEAEKRRRNKAREVCKQAWIYIRRTTVSNLGWAFRIAWMKIKSQLRTHHSKVRGVTYGVRQKLLKRLQNYPDSMIKLIASREYDNPYDQYAIEIYVSIAGKGTACIGYVSRHLSGTLASMMDEGSWLIPIFENVTGGGNNKAFGLNFNYVIA